MERLQFKRTLNAPPEKVWDALWGKTNYPAWTAAFSEGSQVETDNWKKGSKVLFLDNKGHGMVSFVEENIPNEFMSFKHMGTVKDGVEDMDSEETKTWAGALENYTLKPVDGKTELTVDTDVTEDFKDYFVKTWPNALDKLQELSEQN
jgi:uncharacterized protein YndB with AHSA1/START domain